MRYKLALIGNIIGTEYHDVRRILYFHVQFGRIIARRSICTGQGRTIRFYAKLKLTYLFAGQLVHVAGTGYYCQRKGKDGENGKYLFHIFFVFVLFNNQ